MTPTDETDRPSHAAGLLRRFQEFAGHPGEALADTMRRLIEKITTVDVPTADLLEIAKTLDSVIAQLEALPLRDARTSFSATATENDAQSYLAFGPLTGKLNPLAPPLDIQNENGVVVGHVNFGDAYEGPPGHVHGGYVAAVFDELLGVAQGFSGEPGVTGTLTVRYRRPTPLHTKLRLEGSFDRVEGRKIFTTGKMYANGELTADATGLFIKIPLEHYEAMKQSSVALREQRGSRKATE